MRYRRPAAVVALLSVLSGAAPGAQQGQPFTSMEAAVAEFDSDSPERSNGALDYVLANLPLATADVLLTVSMVALSLERLEDAGFLYYAGQLRSRIDQQRFPPVGKGGNSPAAALGALQAIIGAEINPAVMRDPQTLTAVLNRLTAWDVAIAGGYDPGWTFTKALTAAEAEKVTQTVKADYLRQGKSILSLLGDPEYLAALRESQAAAEGDLSDETKLNAALERHRRAQERMCAIEKKMKIEGMCEQPK